MPVDAASREQVASAFLHAWEFLGETMTGASIRIDGRAEVGLTGLPVPTLNGVWATSPEISPERLRALIDEVDPAVPHCVQLPVDAPAELARVPREHALTRIDDIPLMALEAVTGTVRTN